MWVEQITNRNTHKSISIGTFHSVAQATKAYDIHSVCLHGSDAWLNFPFDSLDWLEDAWVNLRMVDAR
jgi:hypothetical protein